MEVVVDEIDERDGAGPFEFADVINPGVAEAERPVSIGEPDAGDSGYVDDDDGP